MASLAKLLISVGADVAGFETDMDRMTRNQKRRMAQLEREMNDLGRKMGVAFVATAAAMTVIVKKTVDMADRMRDLSQQTGISTETLSGYAYAAEQSGTSLEALTGGIRKMQRSITDAAAGTAEQAKAFERLGLSAAELVKMSPDKAFELVAERLSQMENATVKAATAQEIFGRSGTQLLPIMNEGAKGIQAMTERVKELGASISQEFSDNADRFNDNIGDMKLIAQGAGISFTEALIPGLIGFQEYIIKAATGTNDFSTAGERVLEVIKRMVQAFVALKAILAAVGTVLVGIVAAFGGGLKAIGGALVAMNAALANSLAALSKGDFAASAAALADMPAQIADAWNAGSKEMADALAFIPDNLAAIKDETDQTLADLDKAFAGAGTAANRLGDVVVDTTDDIINLGSAADKTAKMVARLDYEMKQLTARSKAANQSISANIQYIEEQEQAYQKLIEAGQTLVDQLFPLEAATRRYNEEMALLARFAEEAGWSSDRLKKAQQALAAEFAETRRQIAGTAEDVDLLAAALDEGARIMERAFQDMWENLLSGADNTFDNILKGFQSLLAQMIHQATTQKIILNVQQGLAGTGTGPGGGINFSQLGPDLLAAAGAIFGQGLADSSLGAFGAALGGIAGKWLGTQLGWWLGAWGGPIGLAIGSIAGAVFGDWISGLFERDLRFSLGGANNPRAGDAQRITTPLGDIFGLFGQGNFGSLNDPNSLGGELAKALTEFDTQIAEFLDGFVSDEQFAAIQESLKGWTGVWGEGATAADVLQSRFSVILSNFTTDIQDFVRGADDFEGQIERFGVALTADKLIRENPDLFTGRTTGELLNLVAAMQSGSETMGEAFNEFIALLDRVVSVQQTLQAYAGSDLLADFAAMTTDLSLTDALARVNTELAASIANFDGSIESFERIGSLAILAREGELKLLAEIDAIQKGINANLDTLTADILGISEPDKTGEQLFNEAQALIGQITDQSSAADIAGIERQFNAIIRSMTPEDQALFRNELVGLIELFRGRSNSVLEMRRQETIAEAERMRTLVADFITRVGDPLDIIAASLEGENLSTVMDEGLGEINASVASIGPQVAAALAQGLSNVTIQVTVANPGLITQ